MFTQDVMSKEWPTVDTNINGKLQSQFIELAPKFSLNDDELIYFISLCFIVQLNLSNPGPAFLFRIDRCLVYTGSINKYFLQWDYIYTEFCFIWVSVQKCFHCIYFCSVVSLPIANAISELQLFVFKYKQHILFVYLTKGQVIFQYQLTTTTIIFITTFQSSHAKLLDRNNPQEEEALIFTNEDDPA